MTSKLIKLRERIDAVDIKLVKTLEKRVKLVREVGIYKAKYNISPLDRKRWQEVINSRLIWGKISGLHPRFIKELFELIHKYSLVVEKKVKNSNLKNK